MTNDSSQSRAVRFAFGEHLLDLQRRELRRCGELIAVEPQVFDLLTYLVVNRHRVVGKDDIIEAVWGGRIVSDSAVTTRINAVRRAVGDSGAAQQVIRTMSRKGVRFVAEVKEEEPSAPVQSEPASAPVQPARAPLFKHAIVVSPVRKTSVGPDQDHFDGVLDEFIIALSRVRGLYVIARYSSVTNNEQAVDASRVRARAWSPVNRKVIGPVNRTWSRIVCR